MKSLVDLGSGVHCQAEVPDTSRIFLSIGLGFHLECELPEASSVLALRRWVSPSEVHAVRCMPHQN